MAQPQAINDFQNPRILHSVRLIDPHESRKNYHSVRPNSNEHIVTFQLTFAIAVDKNFFSEKQNSDNTTSTTFIRGNEYTNNKTKIGKLKQVKSNESNNNPNNFIYLHFEFNLLEEENFQFSTDVVIFSKLTAKVYPTSCTSKLIIPWIKEENLWILWTEFIPVQINSDRIFELWKFLQKHGGIPIKCWNQRDKCNIQTRFDRPRSVPLNEANFNEGGIANENLLSHLKKSAKFVAQSGNNDNCNNPNLIKFQNVFTNQNNFPQFMNCKGESQVLHKNGNLSELDSLSQRSTSHKSNSRSNQTLPKDSNELFTLLLNTGHLFRKNQPEWITCGYNSELRNSFSPFCKSTSSISSQIEKCVKQTIVGLQTNNSLLTEQNRKYFQPIVICMNRLSNLPTDPYQTFEEMSNKCKPITLRTRFSDFWEYNSSEYIQNNHVIMNEVQVILTGLIPDIRLKEIILSNSVIIDLYDRVSKPVNSLIQKQNLNDSSSGLFYTEADDDKIGQIQPTLNTTNVLTNELSTNEYTYETDHLPSGRAYLYLDELIWMKQCSVHYNLPILPISESELDLLNNEGTINLNNSDNYNYYIAQLRNKQRYYINYIEKQCELSLTVEFNFDIFKLFEINLTKIIKSIDQTQTENTKEQETVNKLEEKKIIERIVFMIINSNEIECNKIIENLKIFIIQSNASVFDLPKNLSINVLKKNLNSIQHQYLPCIYNECEQNQLCTNTNNRNVKISSNLITGFHLNTQTFDLFILETGNIHVMNNLKNYLESNLNSNTNNSYQINLNKKLESNLILLQNSELKFTERLYSEMSWCLPINNMIIPIEQLANQPLLHIRDLLPRLAYCAINRIMNLRLYCVNLLDIVRRNLFPTQNMIDSLIKEFCKLSILDEVKSILTASTPHSSLLSFTPNQLINTNELQNEKAYSNENQIFSPIRSKTCPNLQHSKSLVQSKKYSRNKTGLTTSTTRATTTHGTFYRSNLRFKNSNVFNYSIQKLNSAYLAKQELYLNILPKSERYTYCQNYLHSASFELDTCTRSHNADKNNPNYHDNEDDYGRNNLYKNDGKKIKNYKSVKWNNSIRIKSSSMERVPDKARYYRKPF